MSTQTAPAEVVLRPVAEGDGEAVPGGFLYRHRRPAMTADAVIFTIREHRLRVLLVRRGGEPGRGRWALPGGFTEMTESVDETVARELAEETGITCAWMEQLKTFDRPERRDVRGNVVVPGRDPRGRTVTVAYFALVPPEAEPRHGDDAAEARWHAVDSLPDLAFDHQEIVDYAVWRLRNKVEYSSIGFHFLPPTFSLPQLQRVYEAVLGEPMDRRNFRKKLLASGAVEATGDRAAPGRGRPATLYRFTRREFGFRAWK